MITHHQKMDRWKKPAAMCSNLPFTFWSLGPNHVNIKSTNFLFHVSGEITKFGRFFGETLSNKQFLFYFYPRCLALDCLCYSIFYGYFVDCVTLCCSQHLDRLLGDFLKFASFYFSSWFLNSSQHLGLLWFSIRFSKWVPIWNDFRQTISASQFGSVWCVDTANHFIPKAKI